MSGGGALSHLSKNYHFSESDNDEWKIFGSRLESHNLLNLFQPSLKYTVTDPVFKRFASTLSNDGNFIRNSHHFINTRIFSRARKPYLRDIKSIKLLDIIQGKGNSSLYPNYEIRYLENNERRINKFNLSAIFACSGPLMNAYIVSLLSDKQKFTYGDHLSYISGRVEFPRKVLPLSYGATLGFGFKTFSTYSKKICHKNINYHYSLRTTLPFNTPGLPDCPTTYLNNKIGNASQLNLHWIVDTGITHKQYVQFHNLHSDFPSIETTFTPSSLFYDGFLNCRLQLKDILDRKSYKIIENNDLLSNIMRYSYFNGVSALHPYGTVPMSDSGNSGTVNSSLELKNNKNVFVIGSSSFPDGRLEHPTSLILIMAKLASLNFILRVSGHAP